MSAAPAQPTGRERAVVAVRRALEGPDGPLALALALGFAAVLQLALIGGPTGGTWIVANLVAIVPVALARRALLPAAWLSALATVLLLANSASSITVGGLAALLLLLYLVANRRRRPASAALTVPFLVVAMSAPSRHGGIPPAVVLLMVVAVQILGDARRQRGQAIAERDATRRAMTDTLNEHAAAQERARIARELHDVVAHHVSMVAVQAETARLTTPDMPREGQERLAAIGDTARDALTEMRRLLGVLRADAGGQAERAPQPGLDRLQELIDGARSAGTSVRLTMRGDAVAVSPGVDLTAYRVVQEALTNARRHAPGADVEVEVRYGDGSVRVGVRDNGPGAAADGDGGHGLIGMHERVAMVGGSLRVGQARGGGFAVQADLPIEEPGA